MIIFISLIAIFVIIILIFKKVNSLRYKDILRFNTLADFPIDDDYGHIKVIDYNLAQGFHFQPKNKNQEGLVIVFGGSEGGSNYSRAYDLYKDGYEVLAMYFFGKNNQKSILSMVDISFFEDIEKYMNNENIISNPLTLLGHSKGAELVLLLSQYYDVDNLVLHAPSVFSFQGLDIENSKSSWCFKGKEISYCHFKRNGFANFNIIKDIILNYPRSYIGIYKEASKGFNKDSAEWIYKRKIPGEILVFAGGDDRVWDAANMANMLKNENEEQVKLYIFEKAGHVFKGYTFTKDMMLGGTVEDNLNAEKEMDKKLKEYLKDWHSK